MGIRYRLSAMTSERGRRSAVHWVAGMTAAGFTVTMLVLAATGGPTQLWPFVLIVWGILIFIPLWLIIQAFQTLGPSLRRRIAQTAAAREDRYDRPASASLVVEEMFGRHVVMPRIATPLQGEKALEAATALVLRTSRGRDSVELLRSGITRCLQGVDGWIREVTRYAAQEAPDSIQARWSTVRALAALAAMSKALVAVYDDRAPAYATLPVDGRSLHGFLDSALDFCDDLALQVEVAEWEEPPLDLPEDTETIQRLCAAWQEYADAAPPARQALETFLSIVVSK